MANGNETPKNAPQNAAESPAEAANKSLLEKAFKATAAKAREEEAELKRKVMERTGTDVEAHAFENTLKNAGFTPEEIQAAKEANATYPNLYLNDTDFVAMKKEVPDLSAQDIRDAAALRQQRMAAGQEALTAAQAVAMARAQKKAAPTVAVTE